MARPPQTDRPRRTWIRATLKSSQAKGHDIAAARPLWGSRPFARSAKFLVARRPNGAQSVAHWRHNSDDLGRRSSARISAVGHGAGSLSGCNHGLQADEGHWLRELVVQRVE